ncbi:hypothetical protein ACFZB2_08835 [Streptomyces bobili]
MATVRGVLRRGACFVAGAVPAGSTAVGATVAAGVVVVTRSSCGSR